jgi:hypothetical protein
MSRIYRAALFVRLRAWVGAWFDANIAHFTIP